MYVVRDTSPKMIYSCTHIPTYHLSIRYTTNKMWTFTILRYQYFPFPQNSLSSNNLPSILSRAYEQILDVQFTTICLTKQPHSSKIVVILIYYANIHLKEVCTYITTGLEYIVRIYYLNVVLNQYLAHIFQRNATQHLEAIFYRIYELAENGNITRQVILQKLVYDSVFTIISSALYSKLQVSECISKFCNRFDLMSAPASKK